MWNPRSFASLNGFRVVRRFGVSGTRRGGRPFDGRRSIPGGKPMGQTSDTPEMRRIREKYCVLIPHPREVRAFVVPEAKGWALPEFVPEREWPDLPEALAAIRAQLGIDGSLLYDLRR